MINHAKWITSDLLPSIFSHTASQINQSIYMRKNFEVCKSIRPANLSICVLGLGVCTINGQKVTGDVLSIPYTHYNKSVIYQKYDVTSPVREDKNAPYDFEIEAQLVHTDVEQIGSFYCSDEMLNKIHTGMTDIMSEMWLVLPVQYIRSF